MIRRNHIFHVLYFLILSALVFVPQVSNSNDELPDLIKKTQSAIVTISVSAIGGVQKQGSGFFISQQGHVVTNYHVVKDSLDSRITTSDGKDYKIKSIITQDPQADIAIVSTEAPKESIFPLSFDPKLPQVGEKILVIGSPLGLENTVSDGLVSAVRSIEKTTLLQITAPISHGSSGSPVINMRGEVVGIATLQLVRGQNLNFAVPSRNIIELIGNQQKEEQKTSEILMSETLNKVDKAKELIKSVRKLDRIEFKQYPIYFSFNGKDKDSAFYSVYKMPSSEKEPNHYYTDIYSIHDNNVIPLYHELSYTQPVVSMLDTGRERLLVWHYSEGSGAYLSFSILRYVDGKMEEVSSNSQFDPSLSGEASIVIIDNQLYFRAKHIIFKLNTSGTRFDFEKFVPDVNLFKDKKHVHVLRCTSKGKTLVVLFDNSPIEFYRSDKSTPTRTIFTGVKRPSVTKSDTIIFDDISENQPPTDSDFKVLSGCTWGDYMNGLFNSLKLPKSGECTVTFRFKSNWYDIEIRTE